MKKPHRNFINHHWKTGGDFNCFIGGAGVQNYNLRLLYALLR